MTGMNEHEMNRFWKTHLKGAFPDWIPNDYWTSFWSEKLKELNIDKEFLSFSLKFI